MTRPLLEIDLNAIVHNYRLLSGAIATATVAAVVKDNAYGCGAPAVTQALYDDGCRRFFVAYAEEGALIRPSAPDAEIYVLQGFDPMDTALFAQAHLIPVLSSPAQLADWQRLHPWAAPIALQVETGLNRLGFSFAELEALEAPHGIDLILSHLACADEPDSPVNMVQLNRFLEIKKRFPNARFSLAASDGCALSDAFHFDIVRGGAFLYGIHTFPALRDRQKQAVHLTADVLQIKHLKKGESAGYGAAFRAPKDMRIATVSIGYGDGLFRSFFPHGKVRLQTADGFFDAPLAGRVSMDNLIVDASALPNPETISAAVILDAEHTLDDLAAESGTIGYEVLSAFGNNPRIQHVFLPVRFNKKC